MKKQLLSLGTAVMLTGMAGTANAQLADGSIAPNFTITDYASGTSHTLYDYLDNGYAVVIDMFATWCGPCWSYHNGGVLETLYQDHGPAGLPNVSSSTTDKVMVIAIDVDAATTDADLLGTGSNTQGNWVTGTLYPMSNPASSQANTLNTGYDIAYFPTIYMVCPNRTIREVGQLSSVNSFLTKANDCPAPASASNDPTILMYVGETTTCSSVDLAVRLQNNGLSNLTSATIVAMDGATTIATYNWTGNLATYAVTNVVVGAFTPSATTNVTFNITSADDNTSNNTINQTITKASSYSTLDVVVKIKTDQYPSETSWKIKNSSGATVSSGGPFSSANTQQANVNATLPANDCYTFEIYDSFGDGICCSYGNGNYSFETQSGTVIASGGTFGDEEINPFEANAVGVNEIANEYGINIYPNPLTDNAAISLNLDHSAKVSLQVFNSIGELVLSENKGTLSGSQMLDLNASKLTNGIYMVRVLVDDHIIVRRITVAK
jgi:thiol-disulfide isomerase/thioredoxin